MDGMTSDAGFTRHKITLLSELTSLQKAEQSRVKKRSNHPSYPFELHNLELASCSNALGQ